MSYYKKKYIWIYSGLRYINIGLNNIKHDYEKSCDLANFFYYKDHNQKKIY